MYLFLMRQLILSTSEKAMRGLTDKIGLLRLRNIDGENVLKVGSYLKGALTLLKTHERTPNDINLLIFDVFRSSSTDEFNDYVKSIETALETAELFKTGYSMSPEEIIDAFEKKYSEILGREKWEAKSTTTNQGAAFMSDLNMVICFNCGGIGHTVPNCPKPKDEKAIAVRKKIISSFRKADSNDGNGKQGGGNNNSNGGGNGDGSRKTPKKNGGRNKNKNKGGDKSLRIPPNADEPHEKKVNGETLRWCGRCGKWTDHNTENHVPKKNGDKNKDQGGSNSSSGGNDGTAEGGVAEGSVAGFSLGLLQGAMTSNFA